MYNAIKNTRLWQAPSDVPAFGLDRWRRNGTAIPFLLNRISLPKWTCRNERRSIEADLPARIDRRTDIDRLVRAFYGRARVDAKLGPVFAARLEEWEEHRRRICEFWSSVILRSGRYRGKPVPAHVPLDIEADQFDRWLELFEQTAREVCEPSAADIFIGRARMIAGSLELAIASDHGVMVAPGWRYRMPIR